MQVATIEHIIAIVGAVVVGVTALVAVKNDWKTTGLDIQVTKLLLGLMALGCVIVILSATGVIGPHEKGG